MKYKIITLTAVVILFAGIAGSVFVLGSKGGSTVVITQNDRVIREIDLDLAPDETFDVEYGGSKNTIEIKDGKIRVKSAQCPDKTCVHMGWLSSPAMPIVCLPNHLVIKFADNSEDVDALTK